METTLADLEPIVDLAVSAGSVILDAYEGGGEAAAFEAKADGSPLTQADLASHRVIVDGLARRTPEVPVISEEASASRGRSRRAEGVFWLVDPLDGTKEFLKRTGEFTVNLALIVEGRPVAGIVHAPAMGQSWIGAMDGALTRRTAGAEVEVCRIRTRPASLDALAIVASRDHAGPEVKALLEGLPGAHAVSMGSSLKFCRIAEGAADFYLRDGPTMEWDTAAAQAVLEAAGGRVMTLDGRTLKYGKPGLRNPHFVAVGDPRLDWRALLEKEESNRKGMGSAQA